MRVSVERATDAAGGGLHFPVARPGVVIGHLGTKWAIVAIDDYGTVLVPEGTARPLRGTATRAVVVQPDGRAAPLSRGQTERVRVRKT